MVADACIPSMPSAPTPTGTLFVVTVCLVTVVTLRSPTVRATRPPLRYAVVDPPTVAEAMNQPTPAITEPAPPSHSALTDGLVFWALMFKAPELDDVLVPLGFVTIV